MLGMIFFDLDGTLIDVASAEREAARSVYDNFSFVDVLPFEEYFARWVELRRLHYDGSYLAGACGFAEQQERRIVGLFGSTRVSLRGRTPSEVYGEYLNVFANRWRLFSDVVPALAALSVRWDLGIITNGDPEQQNEKLRRTGIDRYFSRVLAGGDGLEAKPSVQMFAEASDSSGYAFTELCYVGDSYETDMVPCLKLGIMGVLVSREGRAGPPRDCIEVSDLRELSARLAHC
jgi:putative hydrolase of the HAD superfamily